MTTLSDDEIRAYRDMCREFLSESRYAIGELTSSYDAERATRRAAEARSRCAEIFHARETIVAAAIQVDGTVYSVPRPGRHHDVFKVMPDHTEGASHLDGQGFVTSTGRFVDRVLAQAIARVAGQLIREPTPRYMLTSEDVW